MRLTFESDRNIPDIFVAPVAQTRQPWFAVFQHDWQMHGQTPPQFLPMRHQPVPPGKQL